MKKIEMTKSEEGIKFLIEQYENALQLIEKLRGIKSEEPLSYHPFKDDENSYPKDTVEICYSAFMVERSFMFNPHTNTIWCSEDRMSEIKRLTSEDDGSVIDFMDALDYSMPGFILIGDDTAYFTSIDLK